ncbi:SCP2 sterol-binding domain-containing protein [Ruixingdingia sedimenti]|uniref:SCP2 sterol-binding domain-containing protein n=1 Tax=Ruixingdingia sedimenti TaxID=3073604 RepID=A0ABU1F6Z6_9RHOB|nr:SCP2 sterol-binding domain-containing protein [Xinfangfangia sp. LG-4]MDR5652650.1 SCP2 sterol-binding domain-containing protein [Xinfangfangia sp. LG-4]
MALEDIAAGIRSALEGKTFTGSLKFDCGDAGVLVMADNTATTKDRETDCTIRISEENLVSLLKGRLNPMLAMATGKLKLSGNPAVAMALVKLIG